MGGVWKLRHEVQEVAFGVSYGQKIPDLDDITLWRNVSTPHTQEQA